MARIGIVIVLGAVIVSMLVANYMYIQYQPNVIESTSGEKFKAGPIEYIITFEGTHEGNKIVEPENIFVKIGIIAKNVGEEKTILSGEQFYFVDEKGQKHEAVYGEFSANDLLIEDLDPGKSIEKTTQFDVPFDEENQYKIIIRPQKDQSTVDTAVVCITSCST